MPTATKWNSKGKEAKFLTNLFIENKVDTSNVKPAYIRSVKSKYPAFDDFSDNRFIVNYYYKIEMLKNTTTNYRKTGTKQHETYCSPTTQTLANTTTNYRRN